MRKRYLCPKHRENTGSAVVYGDKYHCFGCGATGDVSELGLPAGEKVEPEYVEDLEASIERIKRLSQRNIRGFSLHYNDRGYFLVWPDSSYYKFRDSTATLPGGKYRGPAGHKKPWFIAKEAEGPEALLVEGEFNAMSAALVRPDLTVISPGGAGDFFSRGAENNLQKLTKYEKVYVVTDDDKAGAQAAIQATSKLKCFGVKDVRITLVKEDYNQILVEKGAEALKAEIDKMGMPGGNL